jgi:threonyl-tRNA synthetase
VIEKKMREIIAAQQAVHQGSLEPRQGQAVFADKGEAYKVELIDAIPPTRTSRSTAGRLVRPVPRPAHGVDRADRHRLQADEGRRRLLAR